MSSLTFQTENYKFVEFNQVDRVVNIKIVPTEGRDITDHDITEIEEFLHEIGKWEALIKTGFNLLSDLKIVQIDPETATYYKREFGPQKYNVRVTSGSMNLSINARISLTSEERRRREDPLLPVQEVYRQIENIPKWRTFIKTRQLLSESSSFTE